jgi:hypothetical protein
VQRLRPRPAARSRRRGGGGLERGQELSTEKSGEHDDLVKVAAKADEEQVEWFWAKQLDDEHAELRNYPLFTYGLNWGDVVRFELDEEGVPWVVEVVKPSGNRTIRLFFKDGVEEELREAILRALNERDVWYESYEPDGDPSAGLYTFNVRTEVNFEELLDFLALQEEEDLLVYEDAS